MKQPDLKVGGSGAESSIGEASSELLPPRSIGRPAHPWTLKDQTQLAVACHCVAVVHLAAESAVRVDNKPFGDFKVVQFEELVS